MSDSARVLKGQREKGC
jgi:hypothetical protein